jgi:hypothetical protein
LKQGRLKASFIALWFRKSAKPINKRSERFF